MVKTQQIIFVVDSDRTIAYTLAAIFTMAGFSVESFNDPLDAWRAAKFVSPDVLIADLMLPTVTGMDLAIEINLLKPSCKVILLSSLLDASHSVSDGKKHRVDFQLFSKPGHPSVLLAALKVPAPLAAG